MGAATQHGDHPADVVGGFLGFVFIMAQPFRGETAIQPEAISRTIERIETRTQ